MTPDVVAYLAPAVIAVPLVASVALMVIGRRVEKFAGWIATGAVGVSFLLGVALFLRVIGADEHHRSFDAQLWEWFVTPGFRLDIALLVDPLSVVMVLVVTGVGALIHAYSIEYMHGDIRYARYFAYLNLFVAAMLTLVLAGNLLVMYVGWEGVGLCSYLLIGHWFERRAAHNAAKKAFLVNRVGDVAFLIGIILLAVAAGSVTFGELTQAAVALGGGTATVVALLLFAGATAKSAQIPLYVWLPDAMEGPTPVSALIHAATMVTAGVFMVVRMFPLFEASGAALVVVAWIGVATALWAALMAAAEYDIKRVLAYSTISQIGYMFLGVGVGAYSAGMFHLVTHAFFKALMFLGAGAVMHALGGETDMRKMGGLRRHMPVVGLTFAAGWLAISGVVPFAGFFSKDAILASAWADGRFALWAIGVVTAGLTAFYMSRLYLRVFEGKSRLPEGAHPHDAPRLMAVALVPLAVLSVVGGAVNLPGLYTLEHFLEPVVGIAELPHGFVPWLLAGLALVVASLGIGAAWALYVSRRGSLRRRRAYASFAPLIEAARAKFYVDELYGRGIVLPGKSAAALVTRFDRQAIDGTVNWIARVTAALSDSTRRIQTGYVRSYAALFLVGVVLLFLFSVLRIGGA